MTARRVAAAGWGVSVALCIAGFVFAAWQGQVSAAVAALVSTIVPTTGAIVARHVPRNPVGWSQLAGGLLGSAGTLGVEYPQIAVTHGWPEGPAHLVAWFSGWAWLPTLATALVFTALWFSDGAVVVRAFRPVVGVGIGASIVWSASLGAATWHVPLRQFVADDAPGPTGPLFLVAVVALLALLTVSLLALAGLVVRWRRADALGRAQLKWVVSGLATVVAFVVATEVTDLGSWQNTLGTLSLAAVAVTMGVAVLRFRLYEIDRIVSRTVTYTLVLAVLAAVYAGIVLGAGVLLPARLGSFGVAVATLAVSALFLPFTRRARRVVDRRFNRRRVDAERMVVRFAERTRHDVDDHTTRAELLRTVTAVVQPAHASLWTVTR